MQESSHAATIHLARYQYITTLHYEQLGSSVSAHLVEATFFSLKHAQVGPLTALPGANPTPRSTVDAIMRLTHLVTACSLPAVICVVRCMPVPSNLSTTHFCVRSAWRSFGHAARLLSTSEELYSKPASTQRSPIELICTDKRFLSVLDWWKTGRFAHFANKCRAFRH